MSRILCTHPGKFGDLLWALPTVRALSEQVGAPVDLRLSPPYGSIAPLLRLQPYLGEVCIAGDWAIRETAPITPRVPPTIPPGYDRVVHLGYAGWPTQPLPFETAAAANVGIDLARPWIRAEPWTHRPWPLVYGWSDEHFELKVGLVMLLVRGIAPVAAGGAFLLAAPRSRWVSEDGFEPVDWIEAARRIAAARVFCGDCSALHVLAVAIGRPAVIVEPAPARHHPIFWPLGMDGPQVRCVRGIDGQPTFDARHVADALRETLRA